ncbi:S8/S53 family peptidase [Jatrophihabitans fulvus]
MTGIGNRRVARRAAVVGAACAVAAGGVAAVGSPGAQAAPAPLGGPKVSYNVLAATPSGTAAAERAVRASGGTVVKANRAIGLLTVTAPSRGFTQRLDAAPSVGGTSRVVTVGKDPQARPGVRPGDVTERATKPSAAKKKAAKQAGLDPLDSQLWGLKSVRSDLARTVQPGDRRVKVGIIDTGVDGSHPDIAPHFDAKLSRNFTQDIPTDPNGEVVDGPCEFRGCVDPADHDDNGHGTHVAGTIGAAVNGLGVSGVAPDVTLVNVRAGQDSGYFFLQPVVDALTYSADAGIDVVNMSFYVDPWLYNCTSNPADSPAEQEQQQLVITAMKRAMNYAYRNGVTQVAALGNEHSDLGNPPADTTSPDYPSNSTHPRPIDDATCFSFPVEGPHAIGVGSYGPSRAKADYSNYGQHISVSAPGGWFRDGYGTSWYRTNENLILSAYPKNVAIAEGAVDAATGEITEAGVAAGVQKSCKGTVCGYYQFLQGTSMASPHAAGVAALIVSQYGKPGKGGFGMAPAAVQRVLEGTAFEIPCPVPATVDYTKEGRDASFTATCVGTSAYNGFYGHGSVDAYAAVTKGKAYLKG